MAQLNQKEQTTPHVLTYEADVGDVYCTDCEVISKRRAGTFCCKKTEAMTYLERSCHSELLNVCVQRHALDQIVAAIVKGKGVVNEKGHCFFCRTETEHKELRCVKLSKMSLFAIAIEKVEGKVIDHFEAFLEFRKKFKLRELSIAQEKVQAIYQQYLLDMLKNSPPETNMDNLYEKQERQERKTSREIMARIDDEHLQMKTNFTRSLAENKREKLRLLEQVPMAPQTAVRPRVRGPAKQNPTTLINSLTKQMNLMNM